MILPPAETEQSCDDCHDWTERYAAPVESKASLVLLCAAIAAIIIAAGLLVWNVAA